MKWHELLDKVSNEPFFKTSLLAAGENMVQLRLQLSRWVKNGKLFQLRKGLYTLAPPYSKNKPQSFVIANALKPASYVSLQSALAYYNLIPEHVPEITSITTQRPETIQTPLGKFTFRHVKKSLFWGFKYLEIFSHQVAFVAEPEKALFDLIYLTPDSNQYDYLRELRLQHLDIFRLDLFEQYAAKSRIPKLQKAVKNIVKLIEEDKKSSLL